jgi:hypothetical protein
MRKVAIGCSGAVVAIVVAIPIVFVGIQFHTIEKMCQGRTSKVETVHDAIEIVRAYRGEWPFDGNLNGLRQSKEFQGDDHGVNGGWLVSEWREWLLVRGFDVAFDLKEPEVALECHVLACGVVADCRSLGAYIFKD